MNKQIARLFHIAQKKQRFIIGLMSGTSLDGLDIALCRIQGEGLHTSLSLLHFDTWSYTDEFRSLIRAVFAKKKVDQQLLCGLHVHVARTHSHLVNQALHKWKVQAANIDIIASHGQTIFHAPQQYTGDEQFPNSTLQIGDGDHIAVETGIITISDFRQKHLASGGEGAPLAAYGDYLLYTSTSENRILLNIGGIANFTFLPQAGRIDAKAYATDVGPGNTLMNQYMHEYFGYEMDEDSRIALQGKPHPKLLDILREEPFLKLPFPKTTGPELFNLDYVKTKISLLGISLSHEDIMATLCHYSARCIVDAITRAANTLDNIIVYVSGGGLHNPLLMNLIKEGLTTKIRVESFSKIGFDPDAKEACLFAVLANETISGDPNNVTQIKNSPAVCMGKISFPY